MDKKRILKDIDLLYTSWKKGLLGGEMMPEDSNPHLDRSSKENYIYFTLPMALNYQRNSYKMWESAKKTYEDLETTFVFNPEEVIKRNHEEVQKALTKYKLALQKEKQTEIWITLCKTLVELYDGDIRNLFIRFNYYVKDIKEFIQISNKKKFPYLSGNKICNYWLYVIYQYTNCQYHDLENITIAPDTHVIKATNKLGIISDNELIRSNVQDIVSKRWEELLQGSKYHPIDIHTPLWLWSRSNFKDLGEKNE